MHCSKTHWFVNVSKRDEPFRVCSPSVGPASPLPSRRYPTALAALSPCPRGPIPLPRPCPRGALAAPPPSQRLRPAWWSAAPLPSPPAGWSAAPPALAPAGWSAAPLPSRRLPSFLPRVAPPLPGCGYSTLPWPLVLPLPWRRPSPAPHQPQPLPCCCAPAFAATPPPSPIPTLPAQLLPLPWRRLHPLPPVIFDEPIFNFGPF